MLAEASDLAPDTVRRLESRRHCFAPSLLTVAKLCKGLEISMGMLFTTFDKRDWRDRHRRAEEVVDSLDFLEEDEVEVLLRFFRLLKRRSPDDGLKPLGGLSLQAIQRPGLSEERGDSYDDLADATWRGTLDSVPHSRHHGFRHVYEVEFDDWNRMVASLLEQVVADARTVEQASRVLGIPWREIEQRTHWALHLGTGMNPSYIVVAGRWHDIKRQVVGRVLEECGSIRSASERLGVPRSTLQAWVKKLGLG